MLVEDTKWLDAEEFLAGLEISQTMPGLNAVNMSVLVGDRLRGPIGSLVAAIGMVAPGAIVVWLLGYGSTLVHHATPVRTAAIAGVAAGAVGLLAAITIKTGKNQFLRPIDLGLMIVTYAAMSIIKLPLFVVLLTLAPIAIWIYRPRKEPHPG
jgi:chromate transporter